MTATETTTSTGSMQWSDAYLLGFGPMDTVHEEFVHILGKMQSAPDAELRMLLDQFTQHLTQHFDMENVWMLETDFPPRDCHMGEHAAVLESVQEVRELLAQGDVAICRELVAQLADWFPKHADQLDSALAHWMTKRQLGGKPVVMRRGLKLR